MISENHERTEFLDRIFRDVDQGLKSINSILNQFYQVDMDIMWSGKTDEQKRHRSMLEQYIESELKELGEKIPIYLELIGVIETRVWFLEEWAKLSDKLSTVDWIHAEENEWNESKPYELIKLLFETLSMPYGFKEDVDYSLKSRLEILEYALRSTPKLLKDLALLPKSEHDVQKPLFIHLENTFKDFTKKIAISKPIKSFIPDCGIIDLRTAIEIKFCNDKQEVKTAISGINEDINGYSCSRDRTRFYSLIYMTGPYCTEERFVRSLKLDGLDFNWTILLVTGEGSRSRSVKKD
jgi:hypothetical protein